MNLPRCSYYYKPKGKTYSDKAIISRIEEIVEEFGGYGYRRVAAQLQREGVNINHKKVLRIMQAHGLTRKPKRRHVRTTDSNHNYRIYPNLIHNLTVTAINQVWIADITYIRMLTAFAYLSVILDLFSRKAIGYAISRKIDSALCLKAFNMALTTRNPSRGVIHHSDQGIQYASGGYVDLLKLYGFKISMSRKGNPYDNAFAESFIKTLKTEEVYLWEYSSIADVEKRLPYFIEHVYNQKRLHSSLGYRPPDEFEKLHLMTENNKNPCQITLTQSV